MQHRVKMTKDFFFSFFALRLKTINAAVLWSSHIIVDNATASSTASTFTWPPKETRPLNKARYSIQLYYFIDFTGLAVPVPHSRHFILNVRLLMSWFPGNWTHLHETTEPCNHLTPLCSLWDAWWDGQAAFLPEAWPQHYIFLTDVLRYKKTPPVITLSYLCSICVT